MKRGAHRQQVPEQLLLHVRLAQEGDHEDLLLAQAQARAAVHIAVQVAPAPHVSGHRRAAPQSNGVFASAEAQSEAALALDLTNAAYADCLHT